MKTFRLRNRQVESTPVKEIPKIGDKPFDWIPCECTMVCDLVIPHVTRDCQLIYECHYTGSMNGQYISRPFYYHQEGATII